jgi:hypothetical protein
MLFKCSFNLRDNNLEEYFNLRDIKFILKEYLNLKGNLNKHIYYSLPFSNVGLHQQKKKKKKKAM